MSNFLFFDTGLSCGARQLLYFAAYVFVAIWLKRVTARLSPGWQRFVSAIPVLATNMFLPFIWSTDELLPRTNAILVNSWLSSFKVLAFCLGRLPLRESMSVAQITAVIFLPIFPKPPAEMTTATPKAGGHKAGRLHDNAGSAASLASRWVAKLVGLGLVVATITLRGSALPRVLLHYLYALGLYFFVGFLMDGPGAVAVEALGLQLVPTFDAPWLSTSLADFWGRRWNITTSSVLRTLVYDPLAEGRLVATRHEAPGEPAEVHRQQQPHHRHHHHHQQQQQHTAAMLETTLRAHGEAPEPACTGLLAASSLIALGPPSSVSGRPSEAVGGHDDSDAHASAHASESGSFASSSHSGRSSLSESGSGDCDPRHPDAGTTHRSSEMAPDEPAPAREAPHHGAKPQPPPSEPCEASNPGALAASTSTAATGGVWAPGSLLRRTLAVHACCLASGLCHEYAIWHVSGKSWHWKWTLFFYMQAPLMTLEGFGRRWLRRRGLRVPRLLANALTLAVLEATAYPLFFGFVETDTDLAKRVVAAVSHNYQEMLQPLRPLLASAAAALAGGGSAGAEP